MFIVSVALGDSHNPTIAAAGIELLVGKCTV